MSIGTQCSNNNHLACHHIGCSCRCHQPDKYGPLVEDPKHVLARERRYALLQAAAVIYGHTLNTPAINWEKFKAAGPFKVFVDDAEALLKELERRDDDAGTV